jgi:hypothetical protein
VEQAIESSRPSPCGGCPRVLRRALLGSVKLLVLALVVLGAVGCGSHPDPLHGDVTFTATQRQAIESGAEWLATNAGVERVEIIWDLPHPADGAELEGLTLVRRRPTQDHGTHPGWTYPNGAIELDDAADDEWLTFMTAHELGHFEGFKHHPGAGVMSGDVATSVFVWTPADAATRP